MDRHQDHQQHRSSTPPKRKTTEKTTRPKPRA
jgi:hypothetical protein